MTYNAWKKLQQTWLAIKEAMLGPDIAEADPIHKDGRKWFFWDECWCTKYGPFDSRDEAEMALKQYVKDYL